MVGSTAGWNPDPYGRHEQRYFDGTIWTKHVFDRGIQGVDPPLGAPDRVLGGPGAPTAPVPRFAPPPGGLPAPAWAPVVRPTYRSNRGLVIALTWMLAAATLVALTMAGAFLHRRQVLIRAGDGDFVSFAEADRADDYVGAASGAAFVLGLAIFVVLIVFMFRAARNTEVWRRESPRWAAGWTIGGWFIPCASYVIPFLVMQDIWRRSPEATAAPGADGKTGLLWWWWLPWVGGQLLFVTVRDNNTAALDTLIRSDVLRICGSLALVAASFVLVLVVRALDQRQQRLGEVAPA